MSSETAIVEPNGGYSNKLTFGSGSKQRYLIYATVAVIILLLAVFGLSVATFIKARQQNQKNSPAGITTTTSIIFASIFIPIHFLPKPPYEKNSVTSNFDLNLRIRNN